MRKVTGSKEVSSLPKFFRMRLGYQGSLRVQENPKYKDSRKKIHFFFHSKLELCRRTRTSTLFAPCQIVGEIWSTSNATPSCHFRSQRVYSVDSCVDQHDFTSTLCWQRFPKAISQHLKHTPRVPGGASDHTTTFGYGYGRSGTQWICHGGNSDQHSDCEVSQNRLQWKKCFKDPKKAPDIPEHRCRTEDEEKFPVLTDANGWQVPVMRL